jgi:hypothetical protein
MNREDVSIGEVYRICQRIEAQVTAQNGRVRKLEDDALRIKTFWAFGAVAGGLGLDWLKHKLGF